MIIFTINKQNGYCCKMLLQIVSIYIKYISVEHLKIVRSMSVQPYFTLLQVSRLFIAKIIFIVKYFLYLFIIGMRAIGLVVKLVCGRLFKFIYLIV